MRRVQPSIVPMSADDLDLVADMWVERRAEASGARESARRAVHEGRFRQAVTRDYVTMLLAVVEGRVAGYAWLSSEPMNAQIDIPSLGIDDLYVTPEWRGLGVGRALIAAAVTCAHKRGVDHVACDLPIQSKDANRAMARLGFAGVLTRRVGQTSTLMRRLRGPESRGANIDQLLLQRRRRAMRSRPLLGSVAADS